MKPELILNNSMENKDIDECNRQMENLLGKLMPHLGTNIEELNKVTTAEIIPCGSVSTPKTYEFLEIHVRRAKNLDKYYKGKREMDWDNDEDRIAMVRDANFACNDDYLEYLDCITCPAKELCSTYEKNKDYIENEV